MSGPKRGQTTLRPSYTLNLDEQSARNAWNTTLKSHEAESRQMDQTRKNAENALVNATNTPKCQDSLNQGNKHANEALALRRQAEQTWEQSQSKMREAQKQARGRSAVASNEYQIIRTANEARRLGSESVNLLRKSADAAKKAKESFIQAEILIMQKKEEERQKELKRIASLDAIQSAKNELELFDVAFLSQWCADANALQELQNQLHRADEKHAGEQFEEARKLAEKALVSGRHLYEKSLENQKRVESRNIVTKALVDALKELKYDKPDVNYVPQPGEKNVKLGNITIFAKSPGETGDMRLAIDLDGKVDMDVSNIPEGKELQCHQRIVEIQEKTTGVVDFVITDWGRAANVQSQTSSSGLPGKVKQKEIEKQRERSSN